MGISRRPDAQSPTADERLRYIALATRDALYDWDIASGEVWRNEAYRALYAPDDPVGTDEAWWEEHIHPEDRSSVLRSVREAMGERSDAWSGEYRFRCRDGRYAVVLDRGYILRDDAGKPLRMIGAITDVSSHRQSQSALAESERRFRALYDETPSMYFTVDPAGTVLSVNKFGAACLGYEVAELVGRPVLAVFVEEDRMAALAHVADCLAHPGEVFNWELRKHRKDGSVLWVKETARAVNSPAGRPVVLIVCEDITELRRAQTALKESEARFRSLTQLSSDWFWEQDERFRFTNFEGSVDSKFPIAGRAAIGKMRWELGYRISGDWEEHKKTLQAHAPFRDLELTRVADDGSTVAVALISGEPVFDAQRRFRGYRGTGRDVTAAKRAQAALAASEARFRSLLALSSDWYWEQDAEFRFTFISSGFDQRTGFESGGYLGKRRWEIEGLAPQENDWGSHKADVAARRPYRDIVLRRRLSDGSLRYFSASGEPVFDCDGRFAGYRGTGRDITAAMHTQEALAASELRFRALYDETPSMYFTVDPAGVVLSVNEFGAAYLGYTPGELIGKSVLQVFKEEDKAAAVGHVNDCLAHLGQVFRWELRKHRKDGSMLWVKETARAVTSGDGLPVVLIVCEDITAHKAAEDEIRTLNTELERRVAQRTSELLAANRELEAFCYSVSHDLRAPVFAVDGFARLVAADCRGRVSEDTQRMLDRVIATAEHMGALIDGLLSFAQLPRHALKKMRVEPELLVRQVLEELTAGDAHPRLQLRIGELPACEAEPLLLKQVFANLMSNAIKYSSRRDRPEVEIGAVEQGGTTAYFVRDNGAGFDMRYAEKLFSVFERLHTQDEYAGVGVGLAIVQKIVQRHGGRIWAEAAPEKGATFYFTIG